MRSDERTARVRPLSRADRDTVIALLQATAMFTPVELDVAVEQVDLFLDRPDQKDYLLAVVENPEGRVVGYLSYGPTPLTEGTYDLYWMAVSPSEQGRGYGRVLVRWLEEKLGGEQGRLILIETSSQPKYEPTRRFYLSLGYREAARIRDFYKPGDDRIIYVKSLPKIEA